MRFAAGESIGRYVIESLLGEGGMGEVYRARDSKLERAVALNVLRDDADGASEDWEHAVMRMQREARAVTTLSHPGIVSIYDIGEHEGCPFIAMELVGGLPLRDIIGIARKTSRTGVARAATSDKPGNKPGNCKSHDWVLSHWGKSKQSLTVNDTVKRAKTFDCGASAGQ